MGSAIMVKHRLPMWIVAWLIFTSIVVTMDATFVLNRPASFKWKIFQPYNDIYIHIDKGYGDIYDGFVIAQSWCNLVEMLFNLIAIYYHLTSNTIASNAWCFISTLCTFWKTVIYLLVNICGGEHGFIHTGHNSIKDLFIFYIIPNGIWIIIPFCVLYSQFTSLINASRSVVAGKSKKKKRR
eukprot:211492_1